MTSLLSPASLLLTQSVTLPLELVSNKPVQNSLVVFAKLHLAIIITPKANPVTTPAPGVPSTNSPGLIECPQAFPATIATNKQAETDTKQVLIQ